MRGSLRTPALAGVAITLAAATVLAASTSASADPPPSPADAAAVARAEQAIERHRDAIRGAGQDDYKVQTVRVDADGTSHVRYYRTYRGLRVRGGDFVVHLRPDGAFADASVGLTEALTLSTSPKVSAATAAGKAKSAFTGKITGVGDPELFVDASSGQGRLAWETVVSGWAADGQTPSRLHVIVDAGSGEVTDSYDEIRSAVEGATTATASTSNALVDGTGNSIYSGTVTISTTQSGSSYSMVDPDRGNGRTCDMNNRTSGTCSTFTDPDNTWGTGSNGNRQSAGVDAHHGAAKTFDYFKNVHGRNGIFGNGSGVPSRVHYGSNYVNAFWDGSQMTYGDGSGNSRPLVAIDVAGHEMSHGVTENTAGLVYSGESGGLNEATSDIFGNMVEFYANSSADPGDYQVGEKIDIRGNGTPLRYMYDPALDGSSHSCWSTRTASVDVHYSSGVGNHFFFDLAEGTGATPYGTSPVCGSAPAVTGIGREKAEKIWFRALDAYFTSSTRYVNSGNPANTARAYTLRAATDLYGSCSTEYRTVQAAWTAVNVAGSDAPCSSGNDFSVSVSPTSASTAPGGSVTTTVSTQVTGGSAQTVALSAVGLPSGATASFDPSSVQAGGTARLTVATAASTPAGTYPVTVTGTGTGATRTATFTLTVNGPGGGACQGFETTKTGTLSSGASQYQPDGGSFQTTVSGAHRACLDGPNGTDFDLYLQKRGTFGWSTVARSTSTGPDESLTYNGTAGTYRYRVHSYSGSGDYTLGYDAP
ncbi:M4 family metallopeptidase [Planomonospora sp. ID91781]|uniref:M4 family metallopeptidase n=1 Tax=Planomonospora sp. ID91781 TaxID=2738135 RepID=UPI0018C4483C|nr:M4 family metallopeptidase [Planomonospora sp. ID91781]MBG0825237.1 M4 family metallopeptidase [Planomonospora sp. ID91781]